MEDILAVQNMIRCTGVNVKLDTIQFQDEAERITGFSLGTADLLGQMAAADYVDKLPVLYSEFAEAARYNEGKMKAGGFFTSAAGPDAKNPRVLGEYTSNKKSAANSSASSASSMFPTPTAPIATWNGLTPISPGCAANWPPGKAGLSRSDPRSSNCHEVPHASRLRHCNPSARRLQLRINYERELNDQQHAAVTAPPGPALVIAGAGSGKTRTLTYRAAFLLEQGIPPERILLLTFTNKAASEMMLRVSALLGGELSALWGGTFHAIGNRDSAPPRRSARLPARLLHPGPRRRRRPVQTCRAELEIDLTATRFPKAGVLSDIFSLAVNKQEPVAALAGRTIPLVRRAVRRDRRLAAPLHRPQNRGQCDGL